MGNFVTCLLHAQLPTSLPVFLVGIFALTGDTMGPWELLTRSAQNKIIKKTHKNLAKWNHISPTFPIFQKKFGNFPYFSPPFGWFSVVWDRELIWPEFQSLDRWKSPPTKRSAKKHQFFCDQFRTLVFLFWGLGVRVTNPTQRFFRIKMALWGSLSSLQKIM